jgi:O-antigen ligase/predicted negative regulator of RcsB-dependent stress response
MTSVPNTLGGPIIQRGVTLGLPLLAWAFLPQAGNGFLLKNDLASLGILLLFLVLAIKGGIKLNLQWKDPVTLLWSVLLLCLTGSFLRWGATPALFWTTLSTLLAMALFFMASQPSLQPYIEKGFRQGLAVAGTGIALFGIKQALFPRLLDPGFEALGKMKIYSTMGNPTYVAIFLLASLPLTLAQFWRSTVPRHRIPWGFGIIIQFSCLLLTQSRHALAAGAGALLVMFLIRSSPKRRVLSLIGGLGFLGIIFLAMGRGLVPLDFALRGRGLIWRSALVVVSRHPALGVGLGRFGLYQMDAQAQVLSRSGSDDEAVNAGIVNDAHSDFLEWAVAAGPVAGLAFFLLCLIIVRRGYKKREGVSQTPEFLLAFLALLFASMASTTLLVTPLAINFWILAAILANKGTPSPAPGRPSILTRGTLATILGILFLFNLLHFSQKVGAGLTERQGDRAMKEKDLWRGTKAYRRACALSPADGLLRLKYATALFLDTRYGESLGELEKAVRVSGHLGIVSLKGELLTRLGRFEEATAVYEQIVRAFPNMVGPHFVLGQLYVREGKQEAGRTQFEKVLRIKPSPYNQKMTQSKIDTQKEWAAKFLEELIPPGTQ